MKLDPDVLSEKLESILSTLLDANYLLNPFFRISKITPEQIKKYFLIRNNFPRMFYIVGFFIIIPIKLLVLFFVISLSMINNYQYKIYNTKIRASNNLFLSHGVYSNLEKLATDRFFDLLPNFVTGSSLNTTILYTFQQKYGYRKMDKLLNMKNPNFQHVLIPKFLRLFENLTFMKLAIKYSLVCFIKGFRTYRKNQTESTILFSASLTFLNRDSYSNYLIISRVKDFFNKGTTQRIFLTMEGHSYEQLIIKKLSDLDQEVMFILRQHSPITPNHVGLKRFLETKTKNLIVLTTGAYYKNYFESISNNPKYFILGSSKEIGVSDNFNLTRNQVILYVPEASNFTTLDFIYLIKSLVLYSPDHLHILRLHPDLRKSFKIWLLLKQMGKYKNFKLSTEDLMEDLNNSGIIVYRSSAVAIQALSSGSMPIFYGNTNDDNSNVLWGLKNVFYTARKANDVLELIKNCDLKQPTIKNNTILESMLNLIDYSVVRKI